MFGKIQDHFKKPKGLIGRIVGKFMAAENKTLNAWTLRLLKFRPPQTILEVGYGPGEAIDALMQYDPGIQVDGIDISETMKNEASHRLAADIEADRVQLYAGDIAAANLTRNRYGRVFAVNNYMLWEQRRKGLQNIRAAMAPNGRIAITMQPRQEDAQEGQARAFAADIHDDLAACGFRRIRIHYKNIPPETAVCVTAVTPA